VDAFIKLEVNPAKVVALYPPSIGGRLSVPEEEWIPLFGGPTPIVPTPEAPVPARVPETKEGGSPASGSVAERAASPGRGSIRGTLKSGLDAISAALKDDDSASVRTGPTDKPKGAYACTIVCSFNT
jgi:Vam6/Vps39-like protein vacuolar protein sorting-associated protein 39